MFSISFLCASDIIKNRGYLAKDTYFSSYSFKIKLYTYFFDNVKNIKTLKSQNSSNKYSNSDLSVRFYIKDKSIDKIYTNVEAVSDIDNYIKNKSIYIENFPKNYSADPYIQYINSWFISNNFKGEFIIPKDMPAYSNINADYKYYNSIRERIIKEGIICAASLALGLLLFVCIIKIKNEEVNYVNHVTVSYEKVPLDVRTIIFIVYTLVMIYYWSEFTTDFFCLPIRVGHFFKLTVMSLYIFHLIINIKSAVGFIKYKDKRSEEISESLIATSARLKKTSLDGKNIVHKTRRILFATLFLGIFLVIGFSSLTKYGNKVTFMISAIYIFIYVIFVPGYIIKKTVLFKNIMEGTSRIASGDLNYFIEETGKDNLSQLAHNINCMKDGFKKSVENEVKSEKLKSELITNVSHDLKTPLTSIINYVDLLKREDLSKEDASKYMDILDRKSQRLKVLIEDLFDASKLASGSIELNMEKVDIVALVRQALGEFDEKISKSELTFRFNTSKQNIYVNLDGNKTWRVFDNLINNALKYSQSGTRVYIDIVEQGSSVLIIMKNVSAYEMDFNPQEISERLKRGDKSRNTEGSGLGLAIAKNIVELEGGRFHIDIDGDLFKVTIEFKNE